MWPKAKYSDTSPAIPAAAIHADQSITDPFHYSWRMMVWASMGLVIMLTTSLLSPRGVRRIAVLALAGAIVTMMALPFIGDEVVLLSPAAASFDQYPDFEARGEAFRAAVLALGAQPFSGPASAS
jgi:hypothetical protein